MSSTRTTCSPGSGSNELAETPVLLGSWLSDGLGPFRPIDAVSPAALRRRRKRRAGRRSRAQRWKVRESWRGFPGFARSKRLSADAERFRVLVIAHRERDLQVFIGMQAVGVNEMAFAQSAGVAEHAHDFIVSGQQMHRRRRVAAFQRIEEIEWRLVICVLGN